jgi:hypothetical protein
MSVQEEHLSQKSVLIIPLAKESAVPIHLETSHVVKVVMKLLMAPPVEISMNVLLDWHPPKMVLMEQLVFPLAVLILQEASSAVELVMNL